MLSSASALLPHRELRATRRFVFTMAGHGGPFRRISLLFVPSLFWEVWTPPPGEMVSPVLSKKTTIKIPSGKRTGRWRFPGFWKIDWSEKEVIRACLVEIPEKPWCTPTAESRSFCGRSWFSPRCPSYRTYTQTGSCPIYCNREIGTQVRLICCYKLVMYYYHLLKSWDLVLSTDTALLMLFKLIIYRAATNNQHVRETHYKYISSYL